MGIIEPLSKQKRKFDDVTSEDNNQINKSKLPRTASTEKQQTMMSRGATSTVCAHQGNATSSLAILANTKEKKSSIFDSLLNAETRTVGKPSVSASTTVCNYDNDDEKRTQHPPATAQSSKSKKYKIVANSAKVLRFKIIFLKLM